MASAITPWRPTSTSPCRPTTAVPRPMLPAWRTTWRRRSWTCALCCRATPGPSSEPTELGPASATATPPSGGPPTRAPLFAPSPPGPHKSDRARNGTPAVGPAGPSQVPSMGHPQHLQGPRPGLCSEAEQDAGLGPRCITHIGLPLGKGTSRAHPPPGWETGKSFS